MQDANGHIRELLKYSQNLAILHNAATSLRASDSEAANDALRCVANALLLIESGRSTWVSIKGALHCIELLEVSISISERWYTLTKSLRNQLLLPSLSFVVAFYFFARLHPLQN